MSKIYYKVEYVNAYSGNWEGHRIDELSRARERFREKMMESRDIEMRLASYIEGCDIPYEILQYKAPK